MCAFIKYDKKEQKFLSITDLPQKKFTISANDETCRENGKTIMEIESCKLSAVREKTKELMSKIKKYPTKTTANIYQITSINDLELQSKISFQAGDVLKFLSSIKFDKKEYKTNAISIITIEHLSIDVDYDNSLGSFSYIDDNTTLIDIQDAISINDIPLFVSSIKYGKQLFISIQTNLEYSKLEAKLGINGSFIMNISAFIQKLSCISEINAELMIRGGQSTSLFHVDQNNMNDIINALHSTEDCVGTGLYYCLSNLSDNSPFGYPNPDDVIKVEKQQVSILYVIPDSPYKKGVDFQFLVNNFRKANFSINICNQKESDFVKSLGNPDYLSTFNIIMLGGVDGKDSYSKFNSNLVTIINNWRKNKKGLVLFLHDFITKNQAKLFEGIVKHLGYKDYNHSVRKFDEIQFTQKAPRKLLKHLNEINNTLLISSTHESAIYGKEYILIKALNSDAHYYAENLFERVADC